MEKLRGCARLSLFFGHRSPQTRKERASAATENLFLSTNSIQLNWRPIDCTLKRDKKKDSRLTTVDFFGIAVGYYFSRLSTVMCLQFIGG